MNNTYTIKNIRNQIKENKAIFLSCLGATLEYYDFIIYGMMVIYLSEIFFPASNTEVAYLKTFSILSIGYIARPIGGYLFGLIADIYGRKKTLLLVMLVMAASTMMIGLLPTYETVGVLSPILLTLARVLQGLSFGAEMPNMTTIIKENTKTGSSGKYFGFMMSSTAIGTLLASFIVAVITRQFLHQEIIAWVWRLPFLLGGTLALLVFLMRTRIEETPDFLKGQQSAILHRSSKQLTRTLFKSHWKDLLQGMLSTLFFSYLIIFSLYLPGYLKQYFNYTLETVFSWMTFSILLTVFWSPLFGHIFDRLNRAKALKIVTLAFLLFLSISLKLLKLNSQFALAFFLLGYQLFIAIYATNNFVVLSTLFPVNMRSTGIGVCYNTAYSIASVTPLILTPMIHATNYSFIVMLFSTIIVALTVMGCSFRRDNLQHDI
ncbi:MAG TPA: MFS transporter [Gammaproteobacteria bacterium]|nr:MFS transporter [Gammaproteobacteria bacterium]